MYYCIISFCCRFRFNFSSVNSIRVYPSEIEHLEYEIQICELHKLTDMFFKFREHDRYVYWPVKQAKEFLHNSQITISAGAEFVLLETPEN